MWFHYLLRRCLVNVLSTFYTKELVTDPKYKFSPSGTYYAPPKGSYEDYVEFIKELPMSQHPEVFGMHDNVDISRQLQETRQVCVCVCVMLCVHDTVCAWLHSDQCHYVSCAFQFGYKSCPPIILTVV